MPFIWKSSIIKMLGKCESGEGMQGGMDDWKNVLVSEEGGETRQETGQDGDDALNMDAFMDQAYGVKALKRGDIVPGTIVRVGPSEVLIDIGSKSEGSISGRELERLAPETLTVGDKVWVYVVRPEDRHGNVILSLSKAELERDWLTAQELFEADEMFEGTVADHNKGGVIVCLGKVRGFVPASQLFSSRQAAQPSPDNVNEGEQWASLVGQELKLKIIEIDRKHNRLIFSEKEAMREWRRQQKEELLSTLQKGTVYRGRVSSLCNFGAFVDLGGTDGLIHLSELSWKRVAHPKEILQIGDEVEVYVLEVDHDRKRVALSLKRLQPEPWSVAAEKYAVGQLVEGTVTKLTDFGAFALIDGEIEGLIHISELTEQYIEHPKEVVKEGEALVLRIIRMDVGRRRMGLSLRRVNDEEYFDLDWQLASLAEAKVDDQEEEPD